MNEKSCLAKKTCTPCKGGVSPLKGEPLNAMLKQLDTGWRVIKEHQIEKDYKFPDFKTALDFTNKVGKLAEEQGHHPDILLTWGNVKITLWTHKIDGLSESDFIFAAKCDDI